MYRLTRRGFTLVELLVVIGIIAVLIAILLPTLARARDQAKSAQCLSNLRQIGQGLMLYTNANKGFLVPGWIANTNSNGPGIENYATILVGQKYLPAPKQFDFQSVESQGDSVFRCPDGVDVKHELGAGAAGLGNPATKEDARGGQYWRRQSIPEGLNNGIMVDTWYGINGFDPGSGQGNPAQFVARQRVWPFRKLIRADDGSILGEYAKVSKFRKSSELVLMYDGLRFLDARFNKIHARHNRQKRSNFLMADGHCESIDVRTLPNGPGEPAPALTQAQIVGPDLNVFAPWPYPKWRVDQ